MITSITAREPMANMMLSNSLRSGLHGLIKTLNREVAGDQVTVNALMPGFTLTERLEELQLDEAKLTAQIPARRSGRPGTPALAAFHPTQGGMSPVRPLRAMAVFYSQFDSPLHRRRKSGSRAADRITGWEATAKMGERSEDHTNRCDHFVVRAA